MNITYGNFEIDTDKVPAANIAAMIKRGIAHYLGNEVAAKVSAKSEDNASDEQKAKLKAELQAEAFDKLMNGEVGSSVRGPHVTPIESKIAQIAKKEVLDILRANGIKPPKGEESVKFADSTEKTLAAMVATRREKFGDRITKEAEKALADEARKAKRAKDEAAQVEAKTSEALGL